MENLFEARIQIRIQNDYVQKFNKTFGAQKTENIGDKPEISTFFHIGDLQSSLL